ncbi:H-2 class I histocompatibility antigen, Q9 alpha chain [Melanotaenia boesemani]|uniref:H-2 class I histocompatibility antigen, Q9 alpha chain n=1 Tax=Melanotaenia boesemani TaxID=1250792 RepID=UPI001C040AC2|nr:H-2 class I histocompatibility antigen, Q9 alpha chain [Melanotaenia boesemani]
MKMILVLSVILLGIHEAAAATHSLQYFFTASSGVKDFPPFVISGMVDGQPFFYYDSVLKKTIPKQDWMAKNEGPEYWERNTQIATGDEQWFKANIDIVKQRFNQTGGVHIYQNMYGCDWDDETDKVEGYDQYGYDGEDFVALDLKTESWIAPTPQAVITKHKWDNNKAFMAQEKNYFNHLCPDWVKKYLNYGRSSLMRTEHPTVSFLQKTSSSPVSCHATGFYPNRAELLWKKNGVETHEGVVKGEVLPNNDGTFQMSVSVDLSSVGSEDWAKYECVFQLYGAEDIEHPLEKTKIRTSNPNSNIMIIPIIVAVAVLAVIAVIGLILYKKKSAKRPPSPVDSTEVQEQMIPQA